MQRLHAVCKAESGVPYSAVVAVRAGNLYARIGRDKLAELSDAFCERVYSSDEGLRWFRGLFANTTREAATRNQREFFAQEFGGSRAYEERKGHTALLGRHGPYAIDERAGRQWLAFMMQAVDDVGIEDEECKQLLIGYMRHMSCYVVHGRKLVNGMRTVGYCGRHREGEV